MNDIDGPAFSVPDLDENRESMLDGTFTGSREPMWTLEHEQAWHRAAAFAFALGASAKDVAEKLGRSQPAVQNLLRQGWFQKRVTAFMAEYGAKDIMELFKAEQINSLCTLVQLRDDVDVAASTRVLCARDILDRALGKPMVRVESVGAPQSVDPVAEVARLEAQVFEFKQMRPGEEPDARSEGTK